VSGVPTLTLSTTDETAHSAVLTVGNVVDAEPFTAADNGTLELEVKLAIPSDLTEKRVYIGWLDTMALGSLTPATGSTTTITLTLDDQAGFLLDTGLTAATEWFLATNNANADATQTAASASTGIVATADTYQTFKVVIDTDGNVEGFIDGTSVLEVPLGIDPAAPIAPAVIIVSLDADGIESVDVQYFSVRLNQN
jgi:hypothetical protein